MVELERHYCGHLEGIYSTNANLFETAIYRDQNGRSYIMLYVGLCVYCVKC